MKAIDLRYVLGRVGEDCAPVPDARAAGRIDAAPTR